ncbi:hypothetical protein RIF29_14188 [Crotalaria pallida]|uniref:Uncharacterized protein n=1 Tax=Crotalaria pallida TaxID=3830 RepID=A0AAN9IBD4_CROPI
MRVLENYTFTRSRSHPLIYFRRYIYSFPFSVAENSHPTIVAFHRKKSHPSSLTHPRVTPSLLCQPTFSFFVPSEIRRCISDFSSLVDSILFAPNQI